MMQVRCADCRHGATGDPNNALRDETIRDLSKRGLINCLRSPARASFIAALVPHHCNEFEATTPEVAAERFIYYADKPC
jgi:hypothetical protein